MNRRSPPDTRKTPQTAARLAQSRAPFRYRQCQFATDAVLFRQRRYRTAHCDAGKGRSVTQRGPRTSDRTRRFYHSSITACHSRAFVFHPIGRGRSNGVDRLRTCDGHTAGPSVSSSSLKRCVFGSRLLLATLTCQNHLTIPREEIEHELIVAGGLEFVFWVVHL